MAYLPTDRLEEPFLAQGLRWYCPSGTAGCWADPLQLVPTLWSPNAGEYDSTQPVGLTSHKCQSYGMESCTRLPFYANPLGFWDPRLIYSELFVSDQNLTHVTEVLPNRPWSPALGTIPTASQDTLLEAVCQV